jgi:hypothetical protein
LHDTGLHDLEMFLFMNTNNLSRSVVAIDDLHSLLVNAFSEEIDDDDNVASGLNIISLFTASNKLEMMFAFQVNVINNSDHHKLHIFRKV